MRNLATTIPATLALLIVLGLSGCNTMEGAGEDVEEGGDAIEEGTD